MNRFTSLVAVLCIVKTLCATPPKYQYSFEITADTIKPYTKTIDSFLRTKRWQLGFLNNPIGSFFSSIYGSFSGIDMNEAKAFLTRAFADEAALKKAIETLTNNPQNITYIKTALSKLSSDEIRRKKTDSLPLIMKKNQHPLINPGIKPWNTKKVSDADFYQLAASSFMAYHIVESDGPARKKTIITDSKPSKKQSLSVTPIAA